MSADRPASIFFQVRFLQLVREPSTLAVALGGLALVALSTVLGPLPPLDGGRAWRDLQGPCGLLTGWVLALSLVWSPTGRLWRHMNVCPVPLAAARFWWVGAEALILCLGVLPALILGCAVLPGGPRVLDGVLAGVVLGQVLVLGLLGAWVRDSGQGLPARVITLVSGLVLIGLPPFSVADPRPLLQGGMSLVAGLWALAFWLGCWASLLGLQQALLFRKVPQGA